jgi:hypothetical protein
LNLLDYSLECENLVLKISDTARRKVTIYPPTFAQHPPKINDIIRNTFVQCPSVAWTAVAAMLAILWTQLSDDSFRPFISAVVAFGFRKGDGAVDLDKSECDSSLAPWFAGLPFD